jgi:hypothetical protein
MSHDLPRRFWIEVFCGASAMSLLVLTLIWPTWIELTIGIDPDHGGGAAEWLIEALFASAALANGVLARRGWYRVHAAAGRG